MKFLPNSISKIVMTLFLVNSTIPYNIMQYCFRNGLQVKDKQIENFCDFLQQEEGYGKSKKYLRQKYDSVFNTMLINEEKSQCSERVKRESDTANMSSLEQPIILFGLLEAFIEFFHMSQIVFLGFQAFHKTQLLKLSKFVNDHRVPCSFIQVENSTTWSSKVENNTKPNSLNCVAYSFKSAIKPVKN